MDFEKSGEIQEIDKEQNKPESEMNTENSAEEETKNIESVAEEKTSNIENKSEELKPDESKVEEMNRLGVSKDAFQNIIEKIGINAKLEGVYKKGKILVGKFKEKISEIIGVKKEEVLEVKAEKEEKDEGEKTKVCPKCGAEIPFGSNFCGLCGEEARFNPDKELKNIRKGTKEEQRQKLAEFKEKLVEQKKGIAEIQKKLFEEVEKNPDASLEEYQELIQDSVKKYDLSFEQREAIKRGLEVYDRAHQAIRENTEDCIDKETGKIDGPKLYEKLFNRKPEGRVEVILRPATIYLRAENLDDYAVAYNHGAIDQVDDEVRKKADQSGGCKLNNFHIEGLENAITLENVTDGGFDKMSPFAKSVLEHEEQHVFNSLIEQGYFAEDAKQERIFREVGRKTGEIKKNGKPEDLDKIQKEFSEKSKNINVESSIKDEISAYFKDGRSPEDIRGTLLSPETIYKYGFNYSGGDKEKSEFSQKYIDLVENGILAYNYLLKAGYSKEDTQALLFVEPLSKWPKVVERLSGEKKSFRKKKSDINKIRNKGIHRAINTAVKILKDNKGSY